MLWIFAERFFMAALRQCEKSEGCFAVFTAQPWTAAVLFKLQFSDGLLGERGGNVVFFIDGMPNGDELNGGAAAQFNQESILEFQVLTGGYKAEFGHGSGGVINVVSKGGTNDWHGGEI